MALDEQVKEKLVCAFCLNSLANREANEVKTGKKATSEQILSKDGGEEAISYLCDDCKGREPKFAFNKSGQQVDIETLPSLETETKTATTTTT